MRFVISYKQAYLEVKNINIINCMLPVFKKVGWKYDINYQKEKFIYYFISSMFYTEKK